MQVLVEAGGNVNARTNSGSTPLAVAARKGAAKAARVLIAKGCDLELRATEQEVAPLHEAAREGQSEVLQLLIAAGADVEARAVDGSTALHLAAEEGRLVLVLSLIHI